MADRAHPGQFRVSAVLLGDVTLLGKQIGGIPSLADARKYIPRGAEPLNTIPDLGSGIIEAYNLITDE